MVRRASSLVAAALLAGCAGTSDGRYPSLAPRAVEQRGFAEPAPAPAAPMRTDPALDASIAAIASAAAARTPAFAAARTRAQTAVAAAARPPAGSEPWLDAQVALGDLDVLRAEASEAVTTLDQAAADRAVAGEPPYPALDAALANARARLAEIAGASAALAARLTR